MKSEAFLKIISNFLQTVKIEDFFYEGDFEQSLLSGEIKTCGESSEAFLRLLQSQAKTSSYSFFKTLAFKEVTSFYLMKSIGEIISSIEDLIESEA